MASTAQPVMGVLGGSGVYELDGLEAPRWQRVASPFGEPSDELLCGTLGGVDVAFLPRHGRGHAIPPSEVNYRANIDALKRVGVTDLLSVSACGSLRTELAPGTFVLVDQYVDLTVSRAKSFFTSGCVAHVSMAHPVCSRLAERVEEAARGAGVAVVRGGTYLAMEGPQFSSLAESRLYRSWDCDVLGMTNMPEAKLAREAELCYASVAMVTDYDCWHSEHGHVEVSDIVAVLTRNAERARALVAASAPALAGRPLPCPEGCNRVLDSALITPPEARDPELLKMLDAVAGRVLRDS
ncbi:MAG: S-methyl-5'-thioadenosine phosphorylase [Deltaproteobacteria bacterium]|nr:S-methyl-5'-thioadenosine phosphorylase [Deltaproteobacteria bacterium]MBW2361593.1 S-methyl-5'-thioadenosine phosphorylase [Deltaproteobacteria bacterium]